MVTVDEHARSLCERAVELGARAARPLPARDVVLDPRVTLKCRVPLCAGYGRNLMCPPFAPSPERFAAALARYTTAIVVQQPIPLTAPELRARHGDKSLGELHDSAAYRQALATSQNGLATVVSTLEREALGLGYPFAAAFGAGECRLCDECVAAGTGTSQGEACRKPFQARPSMEAVGVDVLATAAAAGLPARMPATDDPVWTGLLLLH